jgi:predicted dehydrogenase
MSEVRVGLVGCGGMGRGLVSQLVTIEGAKLVAGADPAEESREALANEQSVPTFASSAEMLAGVELDGVIVASPNRFHCPNTVEVAQAGKHVFCEKPMALTMADCRAMVAACATAGVKLQIGQVLRYLPDFAHAIEQVRAGQLGEVKHGMIFRYGGPRADWGKSWRDDPSQVGHYIFEVAVHEIDFARQIFGKPVAVSGWDQNFDPKSPLWSQATTWVIEFEGGGVCVMVEGMFNPLGRSEVELAGTAGALRFGWGGKHLFKSTAGDESSEVESSTIAQGCEDGRRRELREWVEAIQSGGPCPIPGEEGMANIEVALAALEASRRKARVELPLGD